VLPTSGHWPYADAPETVERLLVEFVSRVGTAAAQPDAQ
jgi:pimeloyl-ACP methyl ester carboxylesterase